MFLVGPKVFSIVVKEVMRGSKGVGVTIESYGKVEIFKMSAIFKMAAKTRHKNEG